MMKNIGITLGASACGFFAGIFLASGGIGNGFVKTFSLAGLLSLPTVFVAHLLIDTRATNLIKEAQNRTNDAFNERDKVKTHLTELETANVKLVNDLSIVKLELEKLTQERGVYAATIATLKPSVEKLEASLRETKKQCEYLEAEVNAWETEFQNRVTVEVNTRFVKARSEEIQRIFDEHDSITSEAMGLCDRLRNWGVKVAHGHQAKREIITSLATQYNANLDTINESLERERENYIEQIELLNEKVGRLQHLLNGDLVEPVYGEFGFAPEGKIANAIANWLWLNRKLPLKVTGYEVNSDSTLTVGFTYPRSMPVEDLQRVIESDSTLIARNLGLYAIEKPLKLQVTDCLTVKARRERPLRKTDKGSLYRSKEEFVKFILSQPVRLRVIGEPGAGKTPTVAVILSHILKRGFLSANTPSGQKLPHCLIESSNPLSGVSVKNGDELDFCLKWKDGKKAFKGLVEEYRFRKNPVNANYTSSVGYVWVADEIDNTMAELTKDEAKPFKDALKDGGHVNIGIIVMGQSANVSTSKGLSIDDQKMMTNLYIDPVSIRTFLTQYGERFYSKSAIDKALATLEEIELELEEQNEVICDTARELRIAMVTANRSPVFYQLPYLDSVDIDVNAYEKTLAVVALIRASTQQRDLKSDSAERLPDMGCADNGAGAGATPTQVSCPKCAGNVKRNGKTVTGVQKYRCKNRDCSHGFTL